MIRKEKTSRKKPLIRASLNRQGSEIAPGALIPEVQAEIREHPAIELKDNLTLAIETIPEVEMPGIVIQMPGSTRQMHDIV